MGVREPMGHYLSPAQAKCFYDRFGSRQDWQGFYENPAINELIAHAGFESAQSVFEFGCGTGALASRLLQHKPRDVRDTLALVELIGRYQLPGTKTSTSLPLRTTLLHVLYPDVVPIFDQMVLKAVGSWYTAANQDMGVLGRYIPHAWALADRHTAHFTGFQETPIRLIDMGLWLVRNLGY